MLDKTILKQRISRCSKLPVVSLKCFFSYSCPNVLIIFFVTFHVIYIKHDCCPNTYVYIHTHSCVCLLKEKLGCCHVLFFLLEAKQWPRSFHMMPTLTTAAHYSHRFKWNMISVNTHHLLCIVLVMQSKLSNIESI